MVEGNLELSANKNMHYGMKTLVGVIDAPDVINKHSYYSKNDANKMYDEIHRDTYVRLKNAPEPKKGGVPKILKYLTGIIGISTLFLFGKNVKNGIVKFIKNLPK